MTPAENARVARLEARIAALEAITVPRRTPVPRKPRALSDLDARVLAHVARWEAPWRVEDMALGFAEPRRALYQAVAKLAIRGHIRRLAYGIYETAKAPPAQH